MNKEKINNPADASRPSVRVGNVIFCLNPVNPGIEQNVSNITRFIFGQEGGVFFYLTHVCRVHYPCVPDRQNRLFWINHSL